MPNPEEEKIIVCSSEVNWHAADSARHAAHAILENINMVRQTVKPSKMPPGFSDYLDASESEAQVIEAAAQAIMDAADEFRPES